ncbi:unnamed protein product [Clonostachys solani]|uniref:Uncharacterized protein n=1 Tax=Clonostachys solani TaxID=160281 RepID=A0A9N9ZGP2_9HYPO|nr:unnamed protein product [Clonostachys solani]
MASLHWRKPSLFSRYGFMHWRKPSLLSRYGFMHGRKPNCRVLPVDLGPKVAFGSPFWGETVDPSNAPEKLRLEQEEHFHWLKEWQFNPDHPKHDSPSMVALGNWEDI